MELLFQLLINGIIIGSVYAISSLGYALTYALNINNFAHGSFVMLGGYAAYLFLGFAGFSVAQAFLAVLIVGAILGGLVYRVAIKPLLGERQWSSMVVSTLALAMILENAILMFHGHELFSVRNLVASPHVYAFGSATITDRQIYLIICSVLLGVALVLVTRISRMGLRFRAVADDPLAASTMGISANSVILGSLVLGSILATVAGFFIAFDYDQDFTTGLTFLMKSYTVTIVGGAYHLPRVFAVAYLLGILENLVAGYLSSEYMSAVVFLILIVFLATRPFGLYGVKPQREV